MMDFWQKGLNQANRMGIADELDSLPVNTN